MENKFIKRTASLIGEDGLEKFKYSSYRSRGGRKLLCRSFSKSWNRKYNYSRLC